MPVEIEKREILYKGWNTFSLATIRLENGVRITRSVEDHGRAAAVLAYDPERRTALLVRQFRAPVYIAGNEPDLLEAIAGLIDDGDADDTARREAMEEAGLKLGALEPVGVTWSMPGSSTERHRPVPGRLTARATASARAAAWTTSTRTSRWSSCRWPSSPARPMRATQGPEDLGTASRRCACGSPHFFVESRIFAAPALIWITV